MAHQPRDSLARLSKTHIHAYISPHRSRTSLSYTPRALEITLHLFFQLAGSKPYPSVSSLIKLWRACVRAAGPFRALVLTPGRLSVCQKLVGGVHACVSAGRGVWDRSRGNHGCVCLWLKVRVEEAGWLRDGQIGNDRRESLGLECHVSGIEVSLCYYREKSDRH